MKKFLSDQHEKLKSLGCISAGIVLILALIIYFYAQLSVPFHDYGYESLAIAIVLLNFVLPYLLMKLIFRIGSLRAPEEELQIRDIWEQWRDDMPHHKNLTRK